MEPAEHENRIFVPTPGGTLNTPEYTCPPAPHQYPVTLIACVLLLYTYVYGPHEQGTVVDFEVVRE